MLHFPILKEIWLLEQKWNKNHFDSFVFVHPVHCICTAQIPYLGNAHYGPAAKSLVISKSFEHKEFFLFSSASLFWLMKNAGWLFRNGYFVSVGGGSSPRSQPRGWFTIDVSQRSLMEFNFFRETRAFLFWWKMMMNDLKLDLLGNNPGEWWWCYFDNIGETK